MKQGKESFKNKHKISKQWDNFRQSNFYVTEDPK